MITEFKIFEKLTVAKVERQYDVKVGKIYKIYPFNNPEEMIVIAKLVKIEKGWGYFEGYIIHHDPTKEPSYYTDHINKECKKWNNRSYIADYRPLMSKPTKNELEQYEVIKSMNDYNL